jgi:hypothetical protein
MCRLRAKFWHSLSLALILVFLLCYAQPASASVILNSFTATPEDGEVTLEWETDSEIDLAGFMIQRSLSSNGPYTAISELIPSEGFSHVATSYSYQDTSITNGVTYYYQLEAIDNASISEIFGPVTALPMSNTPTPTPVANTNTNNAGISVTPTGNPSTDPSNDLSTNQASSPISTPGSQPGDTNPAVALTADQPSPTPSLIPLPEITYQFPVAQSLATIAPDVVDAHSGEQDSPAEWLAHHSEAWLLIFLGIIWMALGGYFFFIMHRL